MTSGSTAFVDKNLIYDVGMHRGEDSDYYLKRGFNVIAFEADPLLVEFCQKRFAEEIRVGRLKIVSGAIIGNPRERGTKSKFFRNTTLSVWGTVDDSWAERNHKLGTKTEVIEVPVIDFAACLGQFGIPYYMKIDIEGADIVCLRSLYAFEAKPFYISIESEKVDFNKLEDEINLFEKLGYHQYKAVQQASVASQIEPGLPKEGSGPVHIFELGSSGLYGKDLPGKWLSKREVLRKYHLIFLIYSLFGDTSILRKVSLGGKVLGLVEKKVLKRPFPGWYDTHARHSSFTARK
jgi:FkbM family methyltransferase